ncbi:hypothetical protein MRX96_006109 [Rhipicephalus microplus]
MAYHGLARDGTRDDAAVAATQRASHGRPGTRWKLRPYLGSIACANMAKSAVTALRITPMGRPFFDVTSGSGRSAQKARAIAHGARVGGLRRPQ